jgi:hypothetical protein
MMDAIAYRRASAPQLFSMTVSLNISIIPHVYDTQAMIL